MNRRPLGYEPSELPDCSTPRLVSLTMAKLPWLGREDSNLQLLDPESSVLPVAPLPNHVRFNIIARFHITGCTRLDWLCDGGQNMSGGFVAELP